MAGPLNILILEDSTDDTVLVGRELRRRWPDVRLERVDTPDGFRGALARQAWDAVVADYVLPQFTAVDALAVLRERDPEMPFLIVSGTIGEDAAVEAMRAGAQDYLMKAHLGRLVPVLERELVEAQVRRRRRLAEETLRRTEARFRAGFEQAAVGIAEADLDGRILRANRRLAEMLGYGPEELRGRAMADLVFAEDRAAGLEHFRRAAAGEIRTYSLERRCLHRDGRSIWTHASVAVILGQDGRPERLLAVIQDIGDRRQAEDRLRAYRQRLRALASRLVEAAEDERCRAAADLDEQVVRALVLATQRLQAAARAAESGDPAGPFAEVLGALDQALADARSLAFNLCPPGLLEGGGLREAVQWLADWTHAQHGLPVEVTVEGGGPSADQPIRSLLVRAVRELLVNVVKHAGAPSARVALASQGEEVRVEVADDGRGFDVAPPDDGGVEMGGFGLFDIRERLGEVGGRMHVFSRPGQGTRVVLCVPRTRRGPAGGACTLPSAGPGPGLGSEAPQT